MRRICMEQSILTASIKELNKLIWELKVHIHILQKNYRINLKQLIALAAVALNN